MQNIIWKVGGGQTVNFWLDKWIPNEQHSLMSIVEDEQLIGTTLVLFDATNGSGSWNLQAISQHIPLKILKKIKSILPSWGITIQIG